MYVGLSRRSLGCNLKVSEDQTGIATLTINKTGSKTKTRNFPEYGLKEPKL